MFIIKVSISQPHLNEWSLQMCDIDASMFLCTYHKPPGCINYVEPHVMRIMLLNAVGPIGKSHVSNMGLHISWCVLTLTAYYGSATSHNWPHAMLGGKFCIKKYSLYNMSTSITTKTSTKSIEIDQFNVNITVSTTVPTTFVASGELLGPHG